MSDNETTAVKKPRKKVAPKKPPVKSMDDVEAVRADMQAKFDAYKEQAEKDIENEVSLRVHARLEEICKDDSEPTLLDLINMAIEKAKGIETHNGNIKSTLDLCKTYLSYCHDYCVKFEDGLSKLKAVEDQNAAQQPSA